MKKVVCEIKFILFEALFAGFAIMAYHDLLIYKLDAPFLLMFGKKFSQRGQLFQTSFLLDLEIASLHQ